METIYPFGRRIARSILVILVVQFRDGARISSLARAFILTGDLAAQIVTGTLTGRLLEASSGTF